MKSTRFCFNLKAIEPLHIGTGASERHLDDDGEHHNLALCAFATGGYGWIPGSTLKGTLRRLATATTEAANTGIVDLIFGTAHGETGQKGRLTCHGAKTSAPVNPIVLRQTAVDAGTGASEANKLYQRQWFPENTTFHTVLDLAEADTLVEDALLRCLAQFADQAGVPMGRNKSDWCGALVLDGDVSIERQILTSDGWSTASTDRRKLTAPKSIDALATITLMCPGPYHSFSFKTATKREISKTRRRRSGDLEIPASGVSGALRKRAEWLLETLPVSEKPGTRLVSTTSGDTPLTVVQRLFGAEGYRGSLNIRTIVVNGGQSQEVTSVPIDRFAAMPMATGPFNTEAHIGVELSVLMTPFRALESEERAFLDRLISDVEQRGIRLGKNSARGFGWFHSSNQLPLPKMMTIEDEIVAMRLDGTADHEIRAMLTSRHGIKKKEARAIFQKLDFPIIFSRETAPSEKVTLPYRHIAYDHKKMGTPEKPVQDAFDEGNLHSVPIPEAFCGEIDVSWTFYRPMAVLDQGRDSDGNTNRSPISMGSKWVIPGASVRGNLRSILEAVTSARMTRVNWGAGKHPHRWGGKSQYDQVRANANQMTQDHLFQPDFVQTLFGFVNVNDKMALNVSGQHKKLLLKSRVLFDVAWGPETNKVAAIRRHFFTGGPNPSSRIYSHFGWKRYPVDDDPDHMDYMFRTSTGSPAMRVDFSMLEASAARPLVFRGRIAVHNVTKAELGALLWAITWDGDDRRRHKIGFCKPFGAGVCQARQLSLSMRPNAGGTVRLGSDGIDPFLQAFRDYLSTQGLLTAQSYEELLASAEPGIVPNQRTYQVWTNQLEEVARRKDVAQDQDKRVTAMLKKIRT